MNSAFWIALIILGFAVLTRQVYQIKEEGFIDYIVYGPGFYGRRRGPWYGGRWRYQPWWSPRGRGGWWDNLYEPAPWGPCPGPWCPYR